MRGANLFGAIMSMAVLAGLAAPVPVAQADLYSCAFKGTAGPFTPDDLFDRGIESVQTDLAQGDQGDGTDNPITRNPTLDDTDNGAPSDDGTYELTTAGAAAGAVSCIAVNDDGGPTGWGGGQPAAADTGAITSSGTYNNQICGTGTFTDTNAATTFTSDNGQLPDVTEASYRIRFYAGQGQLDITAMSGPAGTFGRVLGAEGYVNIIPTAPNVGDCITQDVEEMQVTGAFAYWMANP